MSVTAKRILLVHRDESGQRGPALYLSGLLRGLAECGHDVTAVGCPPGVRPHGVDVQPVSSDEGGLVAAVDRAVTRTAPELIIADHALSGAAAALGASVGRRAPVLVICHDTDLELAERDPAARELVASTLAAATCPVVLSRSLARRVADLLGADEAAIAVVPPGASAPPRGRPAASHRTADVAFVGRVSVEAGAHHVIAALPDALTLCPSLTVRLRRGGPDCEAIEDLVHSLDAGNEVRSRWLLGKLASQPGRADLVAPARHALFGPGGRRRRTVAYQRIGRRVEFVAGDDHDWAAILERSRVAVLPAPILGPDRWSLLPAAALGCIIAATPLGACRDWCEEPTWRIPALRGVCTVAENAPVTSTSHVMASGVRRWRPSYAQAIAAHARAKYQWRAVARRLVQEARVDRPVVFRPRTSPFPVLPAFDAAC